MNTVNQNHSTYTGEQRDQVIGTVKGPGEEANQYIFITSNTQAVKVGEFVYYESIGKAQKILGKISQLQLLDHLPDRIFADTDIDPSAIVALIGFSYPNPEIYAVTVEVIGYFHRAMGFVNPRQAPDPGSKVFLASHEMLRTVLNKRQMQDIGGAHLGSLLLREEGDVPVVLDVKELVSTHLAILAGTGSGKSYTAGVLIEELLLPKNRAAILIFDPHGEYGTLSEMQSHPTFWTEDGYRPKVKVLTPDQIKIRVSSLNFYDILTLLPDMSDRQQSFLEKAFLATTQHNQQRWTIQDLIDAVNDADSSQDGTQGSSAAALQWKLDRIDRSPYFSNIEHLAPRELFEPGQVTILQMNEISQDEQQVIAAAILRQANHARMNTHKGKISEQEETYLPFPVFILIEEAHRFAPAHEPSRCKQVLRTILSEGRKFGLGVGLITQRPGKLDSDILSQCMSQFLMRIVNPIDQENLRHSVEAAGRDLLSELPSLSKGQVIVSGVCVNTPVLCKVRQRHTKHGGQTLEILEIWQQHFQLHQQRERLVKSAPLRSRSQPHVLDGLSID
ncbi:MAG: DUF87 domain-containing protein [Cyanobacteriota bacterium]|nr:DUF87 domain-containing protein [Cyanobacteriota bacterium]